jgi:hypothetical protein
MRRTLPLVLAVALAIVVDAAAAAAQATNPASWGVGFGLGGGAAIPVGTLGNHNKVGWEAMGLVRFRPPGSPVGFQVDGNYMQTRLKTGVISSPGKTKIVDGTADLVFTIPMSGVVRVRPYLLGGAGIYGVRIRSDGATSDAFKKTAFGLNGGLGLDFGAGPANIFHGTINDIGGPSGASIIPITLGFRIGA